MAITIDKAKERKTHLGYTKLNMFDSQGGYANGFQLILFQFLCQKWFILGVQHTIVFGDCPTPPLLRLNLPYLLCLMLLYVIAVLAYQNTANVGDC